MSNKCALCLHPISDWSFNTFSGQTVIHLHSSGEKQLRRLAPETVSRVPPRYEGVFAHGNLVENPERILFLAGQIGVAPDGSTCQGFDAQARQAMSNVEALLADADMTRANIARVVYYVTDPAHLKPLSDLRQERWSSDQAPAVTTLVVAALAAPDLLVEIEVTACQTSC
ncbi:RidA family protein [Ruegeria sp. 2205SS24-7]|uniref:RidA family protein n=1 Tax=Ruegeria discodermiae TaxID=3064389 RepID=UPI002740BBE6|nr:RidA family protein [Ruegeria sp. 2205SS24-7]MDP5218756.1 RidA family protein [Ruegeria sp. 2205SS24-7]